MTLKIKLLPRSTIKGRLTRMGKDGVDGADGAVGQQGPTGTQGPPGVQGPPGPPGGPDPLFLTQGLSVNATNPAVIADPNDHRAVDINVVTDSSTTNPGFTNEEALQILLTSIHGQNTMPAKRTYLPLNIGANYYGAGQKFIMTSTLNSYSMGDTATWGNNQVTYAGGPIGGDEGMGWGLVSSLTQQTNLNLATITAKPTPATLNTTTTQSITASKDPQTITVASSAGANVGDWLVIGQEVATGDPKMEAVKLTGVGAGTITAAFVNSHPFGTTVRPATLLQFDNDYQFGQDRYLINKSAAPVTAGTVSSIGGGGFIGTGTSWSAAMVGGNALNIGMISLAADDLTHGGNFDAGTNRLRSWYSITNVGDATHLGIHTFSVAGDAAYRGKGPGSGAYTIRPSLKLLRNAAAAGGVHVFENTTATWSVGHQVELVICPYPDVSGFQYHIASYTNGGTYRTFMAVGNWGARQFEFGFVVGANMPAGADVDPVGWNCCYLADSCNIGMQIVRPKQTAIEILADNTNTGKISWSGGLANYLVPDPPNGGFLISAIGSGAAQPLAFAAPSTPSNPDPNSPTMTWAGAVRAIGAAPSIVGKFEVYRTTDLTVNYARVVMRGVPASDEMMIGTESAGTATLSPLGFYIGGTRKLLLGTPSFGQDVLTISTLAAQLNPIPFGSKPGSSGLGMIACFNDSTVNTFGATVAGGGPNNVLAWYNGSNWTVIGA